MSTPRGGGRARFAYRFGKQLGLVPPPLFEVALQCGFSLLVCWCWQLYEIMNE